jgi:hypothetical protein
VAGLRHHFNTLFRCSYLKNYEDNGGFHLSVWDFRVINSNEALGGGEICAVFNGGEAKFLVAQSGLSSRLLC